MLNVVLIAHASIRNALIHVQVFVVYMQCVDLFIIMQFVVVWMVLQAIHLLVVFQSQLLVSFVMSKRIGFTSIPLFRNLFEQIKKTIIENTRDNLISNSGRKNSIKCNSEIVVFYHFCIRFVC